MGKEKKPLTSARKSGREVGLPTEFHSTALEAENNNANIRRLLSDASLVADLARKIRILLTHNWTNPAIPDRVLCQSFIGILANHRSHDRLSADACAAIADRRKKVKEKRNAKHGFTCNGGLDWTEDEVVHFYGSLPRYELKRLRTSYPPLNDYICEMPDEHYEEENSQ